MRCLIVAAACQIVGAGSYPAHWWTPVPEDRKASWEILPQAAKPGEVILSKRNELGILSNFAATPFTFHGQRYASVEGFWQMMLYPEGPRDPRAKTRGVVWTHTRGEVARMTAFEAKDAGALAEANMQKMGIDWVTFEGRRMPYRSKERGAHYRLIVAAMRAKLEQNPKVREILLETGNLILRPDHIEEPDPPAEWRYFNIWMEIRSELQRALHAGAGPGGPRPEGTPTMGSAPQIYAESSRDEKLSDIGQDCPPPPRNAPPPQSVAAISRSADRQCAPVQWPRASA